MSKDSNKYLMAKIAGEYWPAVRRPDGLLVDLRLYVHNGPDFHPDALLKLGVPVNLVTMAGLSEPKGFVLLP